jgi:uncharacterized protein YunC (DUF1805 family)
MSSTDVRILTASSSATASPDCAGQVLVSGSYGGEYNAFHAAKWGLRGVVLCDAGVGKDNAGIKGLPYLDRIGLPAATADAMTCHIADADHMLEHGTISFVNEAAAALGCKPGQSVKTVAEAMKAAGIINEKPPQISGGKRYVVRDNPGEPKVVCLDAAPMLEPGDAGQIAVTGSHAALFRGLPDDVIKPDVLAIFFSDAGIGLDEAGVARLADLDKRTIPAGTASAESARIGDSRSIFEDGILSRVNASASAAGLTEGMTVSQAITMLIERAKIDQK